MQGKFYRGLAAIAVALAALALFALQPNVASEQQNSYVERTVSCMDLLLNDPAAHASECGGSEPAFSTDSLSDPVTDNAPPAPDPCPGGGGGGVGGGAGNAGNAGNPCSIVSGHLAPLLMELFVQGA